MTAAALTADVLALSPDQCALEVERIGRHMIESLRGFHKRGVVLGLSGGVDSSVCAALAVRAFGPAKVHGLLLPERDSAASSADRGGLVAQHLGVEHELVDIAPALAALGCYRDRDTAIRRVFPDYGDDWKCKIVIAGGARGGINFFRLVVQSPAGEQR